MLEFLYPNLSVTSDGDDAGGGVIVGWIKVNNYYEDSGPRLTITGIAMLYLWRLVREALDLL